MRTLMTAMFCLALAGGASAQPKTGQTPAEFEAAVTAELASHGDKMGYALDKCALKPGFGQGETYLSRAISQDEKLIVLLAAVEGGKVTRWQEFALPKFEGWITHHTTKCRGDTLELRAGKTLQRYRWTGKTFTRIGK